MNKNQYRIIFNKARGMMMVVAEIATSRGSCSGNTFKSRSTDGDDQASDVDSTWITLPKPITLTQFSSACVLMIGAAFTTSLAQAQIIADPNAPKNQQATVLNTANGLPQVNIQTPNAQGISRNTYTKFDVDPKGVILNNSRTSTQTQQAGWIQGNPWLAKGGAKIILNEVNSNNPSLLHGYIEVAGQRAQVIVANPSGISCEGCGFINASRATLTTGTPLINGGNLESYRVQRGTINIGGAGLDTRDADYTDLIAHAVQANAGVWAKNLNVITGANDVGANNTATGQNIPTSKISATEAVPQFAIDVAQLGGMYAGKITLIGTEAGVGVRSAGTIGATAGDVVITSDGRLENRGQINSTNAQINAAGGVSNSGKINTLQELKINTPADIDNQKGQLNAGRLAIQASSLDNRAGQIQQTGTQALAIDTASLNNSAQGVIGAALVVANPPTTGGGDPIPGQPSTGGGDPIAQPTPSNPDPTVPVILADGAITISGQTQNQGGQITANGLTSLSTHSNLDNSQGTINTDRINVTGQQLINTQGNLTAREVVIQADQIDNQKGTISSQTNLPIRAGTLNNTEGKILTESALTLNADSAVNNTAGSLTSNGDLGLIAASLDNQKGTISTKGNVQLTVANALNNQAGTVQSGQSLKVSSKDLNNTSGLLSAQKVDINTQGAALNNANGTIQSPGDINLTTGSLTGSGSTLTTQANLNISSGATNLNAANVNVAGNAVLNTAALDTHGSKIFVNQNLDIQAGSLDNTAGSISAVHNVTLKTTDTDTTTANLNNTSGTIQAGDTLNINAHGSLNNTSGTLAATGKNSLLTIQADQLNNTSGTLLQTSPSDTMLNVNQDLNNTQGNISTAGNLAIQAGSISGTQGAITTLKNLTLNSGDTSLQGGSVNVQGDATLTTATLNNKAGKILVNGNLVAQTSDLNNQQGQITALKNTSIQAQGNLDNSSGQIQSGQILTVNSSGVLNNASGTIEALGTASQLNLQAQSLNNTKGTLRQTGSADTTVKVTGDLDNTKGTIETAGTLKLDAGTLSGTGGKITTQGDLNLINGHTSFAGSQVNVGGNANLNVASLDTSHGQLNVSKQLTIKTTGDLNNQFGQISALKNTTINTQGNLDNTSGKIQSAQILSIDSQGTLGNSSGTIAALGTDSQLAIQANRLDNTAGTLLQTGTVDTLIKVKTDLNNSGGSGTSGAGTIETAGNLELDTGSLSGTQGTITTLKNLNLTSGATSFNGGTVNVHGDATLNTGALDNTSGKVLVNGALIANVTGDLSNNQGVLSAQKSIDLTSQGNINNQSGKITATKQVNITTTQGVNNGVDATTAGQIAAGTSTSLTAANVINSGSIYAGKDTQITATNTISNSKTGVIAAQGNTQLSATGQQGTINSTGTLAAGLNQDGSLSSNSSDLTLSATQAINANGTNLASEHLTATGNSISLANSQTRANAIDLTAYTGNIDLSQSTVTAVKTLSATANSNANQQVINNDGHLSAEQLTINASNLSNVAGQIVQTGDHDLTLAVNANTGLLDNSKGTINTASQNLTISGHDLSNAEGKIAHVGTGMLSIQTDQLEGVKGQIGTNGALNLAVTGAANLSEGQTTAVQQLTVQAGSLNNHAGQMIQSGSGDTQILVKNDLDNSAGSIGSNGNVTLDAGSINNQAGTIQAAGAVGTTKNLTLNSTGLIDNSTAGKILSSGATTLTAGSVDNTAGVINASQALNATVTGDLNNTSGNLGAMEAVQVNAQTFENSKGLLASQNAALMLTTTGVTDNNNGTIGAKTDLTLSNQGLVNNTQGKIAASTVQIDTQGNALDNSAGGAISANNSLSINSGALNNDTGLIQTTNANSALTINTQGQTLTNTNSGTTGGISSQGTLSLTTGDLNNQVGFIGATQDLTATAGNITNTQGGQISSATNLSLTGSGLDNQGGKVQTQTGSLTVNVGSGTVNNTGSLIQAGGITAITAGTVINDQTSAQSQGIQGTDVNITTSTLSNQTGQILGSATNGNVSISASTALNNQAGLISAGNNISVQDPNSTKSLVITNTGGTLIAGHDLNINTHDISADGQLLALNDLSLNTDTDLNLTDSSTIKANHNATINTQGNLSNNTTLEVGNTLSISAKNIDNTAQGTINSGNTVLNVAQTLTNRGLIDSAATATANGETFIQANQVDNLGTGRIYGDHVAIAAITLNNTPENGKAPVIASRGDMDLGVQVLNNNPNVNPNAVLDSNNNSSLILSMKDLYLGGSLDGNHQAKGQAQQVNNLSSTIESQGNMTINTANLFNNDVYFAYQTVTGPTTSNNYWNFASSTYYQNDYGSSFGTGVTAANINLGSLEDGGKAKIVVDGRDQSAINAVQNNTGVVAWSNTGDSSRGNLTYAAYTKDGVTYQADDYTHYLTTTTSTTDKVTVSDPGRIIAGGNLTLLGNTLTHNKNSQIMVGGDLIANLSNLNNDATQGTTTSTESGTAIHSYRVDGGSGHDFTQVVNAAFNPASTVTHGAIVGTESFQQANTHTAVSGGSVEAAIATTGVGLGVSGAGTSNGGSGTAQNIDAQAALSGATTAEGSLVGAITGQIANNQTGAVTTGASQSAAGQVNGSTLNGNNNTVIGSNLNAATGQVNGTGVQGRITTVNINSTTQISTVIPSLQVPNNALYSSNPNNPNQPLVNTDPRFTNQKDWLSSNYMLNALSIDPNTLQKRLGDGFYEQQLIKQQVGELTGRRFLAGYSDDLSQYKALMNNGITFAKTWNLVPGVALTAGQMAQLSTDIVWLVKQTITLPDGTTQTALVPQLYVQVKPGDLNGNGTLISANSIDANLTGDLTNTGTIAGRQVVKLNANNINNLGGRIQGEQVGLTAKQDVNNIGGIISANQNLIIDAGRNVNVTTTIQSTTNSVGLSNYSQTNIDRVAGLYVGGTENSAGGLLSVNAGNDLNLTAANVSNQSAGGMTQLNAGNNVNLGTITTAAQNNMVENAKNYQKVGNTQDVGSQINSDGHLLVNAGNQINATAATLNSAKGTLQLTAKEIDINAGSATDNHTTAYTASQKRNFGLSKTNITGVSSEANSHAVGSSLGGQDVVIAAKNNLNVTGSQIISDNSTTLAAGQNINIQNATNTSSSSNMVDKKSSGLLGGSGNSIGFTIGKNQETNTATTTSTQSVGSTIGSVNGNVNIQAGNAYTQTGSQIQTPNGDTTITAKNITIQNAVETSNSTQDRKTKQTGLTIAVSNPLATAAQSVKQMVDASKNTDSDRMKALAGASAALTGYNTANSLKSDPAGTKDGKTSTQKATALSASATVGSSQSHSHSEQNSTTAAGSSITAGGNVNLNATGTDPSQGNINLIGSSIDAGKNANLNATNQINILSAQNTSTQESKATNSSGGVGVAATQGESIGFTANASVGHRNADGTDVTQVNSHINAGNANSNGTVNLNSGGDTNVKGGVVTANTINAKVGGNLNLESLQDTSTYKSNTQNAGGSVTVGVGAGGSANYSQSKIDSNYASVTEQSGLKAGNGGFNVDVKGNTDLKGAVISSTQAAINAGKNSLITQKVTTSDIENKADYSATSVSGSAGVGGGAGASVGYGSDSGHASSVTKAGVSGIAGNTSARTGDAETGIANTFDATKVQKNIEAQTQITSQFSSQAPKAIATYSQQKAAELRAQGNEEEAKKWDEGGLYRAGLHTIAGAMGGGVAGALGAGVVASQAKNINELQSDFTNNLANSMITPDMTKEQKQAAYNKANMIAQGVFELTAAGVGAVASGGSVQGAGSALTTDANNRQLHPDEVGFLQKHAAQYAKARGIDIETAEKELMRGALYGNDASWQNAYNTYTPDQVKEYQAAASWIQQQAATEHFSFTNENGQQQAGYTSTTAQFNNRNILLNPAFTDGNTKNAYEDNANITVGEAYNSGKLTTELAKSALARDAGLAVGAKDAVSGTIDGAVALTKAETYDSAGKSLIRFAADPIAKIGQAYEGLKDDGTTLKNEQELDYLQLNLPGNAYNNGKLAGEIGTGVVLGEGAGKAIGTIGKTSSGTAGEAAAKTINNATPETTSTLPTLTTKTDGTYSPKTGDGTGAIVDQGSTIYEVPKVTNSTDVPAKAWNGSGPTPGVIAIDSKSNFGALKNYYPKDGSIEFVYNPSTNTFAVGSPKTGAFEGSPHEQLVQSIGGDINSKEIVGGGFSRSPDGKIVINENSGHYGQNWTPETAEKLVELLKKTGEKIDYTPWKK